MKLSVLAAVAGRTDALPASRADKSRSADQVYVYGNVNLVFACPRSSVLTERVLLYGPQTNRK